MLKLKSLELTGFKSFADKTRVAFPDGITGVIGPNGCGKSNLSDAIGWVLGTQTARTLRGQKMEDFIFGGTRSRKASGLAEVTLTLSRIDAEPLKVDGIEIDGSEFEITRKLYRSGESTYLINRRRCRLMDIHQILEEAGLGFASYALIAQGRIDAFLTAKPLDRRGLIEEAAQITGYKSKRRNAELKLEMAQQNLLRVNDIIVEVERQLRSLRRQAGKTRKYRKLKEEFRRVQRLRLRVENDRFKADSKVLGDRLEKVRGREESVAGDLRRQETAHRDKNREREWLEAKLDQIKTRKSQTDLELDRAQNSVVHARQQIEQTQTGQQTIRSERAGLDASLETLREESQRYSSQFETLEKEKEQAARELRDALDEVKRGTERLDVSESKLEELRSRLMASTAEAASLRNLKEQLNHRIGRLEADRTRLDTEHGSAQQSLQRSRVRAEELQGRFQQRRGELNETELRCQEQHRRLQDLTEELKELTGQEAEVHNQLVALNERLQSLQELELSRSNYSEGVKKVLSHLARSGSVDTAGTLADSLETEPRFERLVEEFLDEELEYVLVNSLDEAVRGVSEIRTLKSGKCTFFSLVSTNGFGKRPLRKPSDELPERGEGVFGTLADIVRMRPEVEKAFFRVLPRQADAVVVSDLDRALHLAHSYPESTFITLAGESLTPRGLVSGSAGSTKMGLLGLKRQKRELERKCAAQQKLYAEALEAKERKQVELSAASAELEQTQIRQHQLEKETIVLSHEVDQAEQDLRRNEKLVQSVETETERLEVEIREIGAKLEGLAVGLGAQEQAREELEAQIKIGRESQFDLRTELSRLQETANAISGQLRVLEERRSSLGRTVERIRAQETDAADRIELLDQREKDGRERLQGLEAEIVQLESDIVRLQESGAALEESLQEIQQRVHACRESLQQLDEEVEQLRELRNTLQEERSGLEVEGARLETQLQNLDQQCREQLGTGLEEALEGVEIDGANVNDVASRYEQMKRKLENFGPINMTALQEYQEHLERHTFLTQQRTDIEQSIADTTKAIQELNRRSRSRFAETFETVNRNFKEVFQKLFGGGECGMTLLDEEDVLESGIDIYAQPPGKRLQNVMLLSGGEKALTVFALLIAIFMYRPSRFCVLDEVDAPLDDANVRRFTKLISEMSEEIQFIVVTHNKRTMESAQVLYGITMQEPGVSKVVSAQF
ncbi:MAG: chromosome segregation protein SMC [Acidobacteriota bacterium]